MAALQTRGPVNFLTYTGESGTHLILVLHGGIAANTSYFSTASASAARTENSRDDKSGCGWSDMNCKMRSTTAEVSGKSTTSRVGEGAIPSALANAGE